MQWPCQEDSEALPRDSEMMARPSRKTGHRGKSGVSAASLVPDTLWVRCWGMVQLHVYHRGSAHDYKWHLLDECRKEGKRRKRKELSKRQLDWQACASGDRCCAEVSVRSCGAEVVSREKALRTELRHKAQLGAKGESERKHRGVWNKSRRRTGLPKPKEAGVSK